MCAVSAVYQYGRNIPFQQWEHEEFRKAFEKLLEQAKEFDKQTKQPDCEDPEKMKWWSAVEEAHGRGDNT